MSKGNLPLTLVFFFAQGLASVGNAQETDFTKAVPSADELVDALKAQRTRAIVPDFTECSQTRGIEIVAPTAVVLDIKFEFDAATIAPSARVTLDRLGAALAREELADDRFLVEGHTDSKGSEAYNLALSEERALSVGEYLRSIHGIAADRLSYACKGESELLDTANPESAVNRRVKIRNLGG